MIKLVSIMVAGADTLELRFSDGTAATWNAGYLISRATSLTAALADPGYFARAFVEGGALAWPNGLELSPDALHRRLREDDKLRLAA